MGIIKGRIWKIVFIAILVQVIVLSGCHEEKTPLNEEKNRREATSTEEEKKQLLEQASLQDTGEKLFLAYDDRYTFEKKIEQIQTIFVSSRQTGSTETDSAILCQDPEDPSRVVACGCGNALVYFHDGTRLDVTVSAAPISLFLLVGQSNAEGRINDLNRADIYKSEWIINPEGSVYSTYGVSDNRDNMDMYEEVAWYEDVDGVGPFGVQNYERFLPKSLTDNSKNNRYNRTNSLTDAKDAIGKGGIDSALGYKWHQLTGEKVWIVNASRHGSSIKYWNPGDKTQSNFFWAAVNLYSGAEAILDQEIEAGHYILSHKGIFWCQGEADGYLKLTPNQYVDLFDSMHMSFFQQLDGRETRNLDRDMEFFGIIIPRASLLRPNEGEDYTLCGARMVQYYETMSEEYPQIYMASALTDLWTDDDSVREYFLNKYESEDAFNNAFPMPADNVSIPSTLNDVHETIHYTQLGYNEIGYDAAYNICCALGLYEPEIKEVQSVSYITDDGITIRNGQNIIMPEKRRQLLAVRILPSYLSKQVHLEMSDNLDFSVLGVRLKKGQEGSISVHLDGKEDSITFSR